MAILSAPPFICIGGIKLKDERKFIVRPERARPAPSVTILLLTRVARRSPPQPYAAMAILAIPLAGRMPVPRLY